MLQYVFGNFGCWSTRIHDSIIRLRHCNTDSLYKPLDSCRGWGRTRSSPSHSCLPQTQLYSCKCRLLAGPGRREAAVFMVY